MADEENWPRAEAGGYLASLLGTETRGLVALTKFDSPGVDAPPPNAVAAGWSVLQDKSTFVTELEPAAENIM